MTTLFKNKSFKGFSAQCKYERVAGEKHVTWLIFHLASVKSETNHKGQMFLAEVDVMSAAVVDDTPVQLFQKTVP